MHTSLSLDVIPPVPQAFFILLALLINFSCSVSSDVLFSSVWTNLLLKISIEFFSPVVFSGSKKFIFVFF